jgi:uncharacterized RmlC-like cupin family protein
MMLAMLLMLATGPHPIGMTAMKTVVCKPVDDAKGKSGMDLAQAIEAEAAKFAKSNYHLTALLPGDPPIACFHSNVDNSNLPRGAK